MNINIYAKLTEDIKSFEETMNLIRQNKEEVIVIIENKRSFREFETLKTKCQREDIVVVSSLYSLGVNDAEISNQLNWFIKNSILLVICEIPSTYEFGVAQPINQAILSTLLQAVLNKNKNIIPLSFKKSNAGRNKIEFPNEWDELYEKWERKEISSKEFITVTGLKKATFYNLMTEYKSLQKINQEYIKKYKIG